MAPWQAELAAQPSRVKTTQQRPGWVQRRPDGWVAAEVVGEALEHGQVGAADELTVVGGDAVEGAVAQPDGVVGVVIGS
jgi:hypothetical protein